MPRQPLTAVVAAAVSLHTGWWWGIAVLGLGIVMAASNAFTYRRTQLALAHTAPNRKGEQQ